VRGGEVAAVLGGAAVLAGSWWAVAVNREVPRWEARVFVAVNDRPDALWPVVWGPMQVGSFVGSLVVVGATGVISRNPRLTLAALVGSQAAFWIAKGVKELAARGRPADLLREVQLREEASGLGYVSGHTAVSFALAAVLAPAIPRPWRPAAWALATLIGFARVFAGAHLPLDVIGGAGFGVLCGTFARWAFGLGGQGLPARPGVEPGQM